MELIAAPSRQFRTVSFWIEILIFAAGPITALIQGFSETHVVSATLATSITSTLAAFAIIAKFVKQQIELTTAQKVDVIESASDAPVKSGQSDVEATIKPSEATQPTKLSGQAAREYIDREVKAAVAEILAAQKPRKRRTPTAKLAAQFNPPGEVK